MTAADRIILEAEEAAAEAKLRVLRGALRSESTPPATRRRMPRDVKPPDEPVDEVTKAKAVRAIERHGGAKVANAS